MSLWMQPQFIETDISDLEKAKRDLDDLEAIIEKQKEDIRSYTPKFPMIGMSVSASSQGVLLNNGKLISNHDVDERSDTTPQSPVYSSAEEDSEELQQGDDDSASTVQDNLRMDDSQDQM